MRPAIVAKEALGKYHKPMNRYFELLDMAERLWAEERARA